MCKTERMDNYVVSLSLLCVCVCEDPICLPIMRIMNYMKPRHFHISIHLIHFQPFRPRFSSNYMLCPTSDLFNKLSSRCRQCRGVAVELEQQQQQPASPCFPCFSGLWEGVSISGGSQPGVMDPRRPVVTALGSNQRPLDLAVSTQTKQNTQSAGERK